MKILFINQEEAKLQLEPQDIDKVKISINKILDKYDDSVVTRDIMRWCQLVYEDNDTLRSLIYDSHMYSALFKLLEVNPMTIIFTSEELEWIDSIVRDEPNTYKLGIPGNMMFNFSDPNPDGQKILESIQSKTIHYGLDYINTK